MKSILQINNEIATLQRLSSTVPDDALAQASIAGQISALTWVLDHSPSGFDTTEEMTIVPIYGCPST
jgi:hypothetical protein